MVREHPLPDDTPETYTDRRWDALEAGIRRSAVKPYMEALQRIASGEFERWGGSVRDFAQRVLDDEAEGKISNDRTGL